MILHAPFEISARLLPALRIGDAWLSLESCEFTNGGRATFILDYTDEHGKRAEYRDANLRSGAMRPFESPVEAFETFISFLSAAAEASEDGDNADLFPPAVMAWAREAGDTISMDTWELYEGSDDGAVNHALIENYPGVPL